MNTTVRAIGSRREEDGLDTEGALVICEEILKAGCFVYVYDGDKETHYRDYRTDKIEVGVALGSIRKRIEKMLTEGRSVIIIYDNRNAKIKEGTVEEWLAAQEEADDGKPSPWMTR